MNFFKSVFTDDDSTHKPDSDSDSDSPKQKQPGPTEQPNSSSGTSSEWSLGGLMKTLATRSESVIETYSRDLKEFGSGLKKEIQVAQGSLNTVTHVIDEFGNTVIKGTAQIISQGKDAILAVDLDSSDHNNNNTNSNSKEGHDSKLQRKYSRFDAQLRVVQSDVSTYCEDPYDLDDYREWKSGFVLDAENNKEEIERLVAENRDVGAMFKRFVPGTVDFESFWCRYFYKVFKLRQAEDMRARLVKRAFVREEEELSWDVDDSESDEEQGSGVGLKVDRGESGNGSGVDGGDSGKSVEERSSVEELKGKEVDERSNLDGVNDGKTDVVQNEEMRKKETSVEKEEDHVVKPNVEEKAEVVHEEGEKSSNSDNAGKESVAESSSAKGTEVNVVKKGDSVLEEKELDLKSDKKVPVQDKADDEEPRKDSDLSVVSSQPSQTEEEDLGWDEIEDLSGIDDKKATEISSPKRAELRKRLSVAEDEEDLSWDIEDDD